MKRRMIRFTGEKYGISNNEIMSHVAKMMCRDNPINNQLRTGCKVTTKYVIDYNFDTKKKVYIPRYNTVTGICTKKGKKNPNLHPGATFNVTLQHEKCNALMTFPFHDPRLSLSIDSFPQKTQRAKIHLLDRTMKKGRITQKLIKKSDK